MRALVSDGTALRPSIWWTGSSTPYRTKPGGTDVVDPKLTVAPTPPEGIDITKPE